MSSPTEEENQAQNSTEQPVVQVDQEQPVAETPAITVTDPNSTTEPSPQEPVSTITTITEPTPQSPKQENSTNTTAETEATPTITTSSPPTKLSITTTPFTKDDKTGMATMAGRRHKVILAPGHSHMDWMRKTNSEPNLSGTSGRLLRVGRKELAQHNTKEDCWMVLRGKVYNITPYLAFHPGGVDELMRGAGRDGTRLFDHKHTWVNAESLLSKCLVGIFMPND